MFNFLSGTINSCVNTKSHTDDGQTNDRLFYILVEESLKEDAVEMAYAKNQVRKVLTFDEFVKHISDHNGVFTRGTVKGVVSDTCACLVEQLLMGNKVQFGELGIFSISITCEPAATLKEFSEDNIKEVNILFNPGEDFGNLRSKAEFNLVASRAVQTATIKAVKANETSVDLEAAKKKPNSTENGDNKPSGDGDNTPSTGGSTPSGGGSTPSGGSGSDGSDNETEAESIDGDNEL